MFFTGTSLNNEKNEILVGDNKACVIEELGCDINKLISINMKIRINCLCFENRIPGATKLGNMWVIPYDASKPEDKG